MQAWLQKRLKVLRESFQEREFTMEETVKLLASRFKDKESKILVLFSKLKDEGKIEAKLDPEDSRRRIYRIIDPSSSLQKKGELNQADLHSLLKEAADLIRTRVDYTFILLLLFFKRMSDKWTADYEIAVQKVMAEYDLSREEALKEAEHDVYHDFSISQRYLWDNIRKDPAKLAENFSKAMKHIAERNPQLRDIFENFDFLQFAGNRENQEILRQLVELFSSHSLQTVAPDMLGDAYEWTLRYFAPQKAKEGEVYTAREVIKLIVEYLDPQPGETIYDPACGSGGMLIISHQHVKEKYGDDAARKMLLFGQEVNFRTRALAKMNLYLHSISNGVIEYGDAILYPKFKDGDSFKRFDVVIANPPWNQNGYDEDTVKRGDFVKERFGFGYGPDQSADWLWIQHMLASANEKTGRVGVVIDNGALFRGGKEKTLRQKMVQHGTIEAVILLPEKLFYNTGAPGAVVVLRHSRANHDNRILFINASKEHEQHSEVRRLNRLNESNIQRVISGKTSGSIDGFCRPVTIEEIATNDYNLNVTLYVYEQEVPADIDISKEWSHLKELDREMSLLNEKLDNELAMLGYNDRIK